MFVYNILLHWALISPFWGFLFILFIYYFYWVYLSLGFRWDFHEGISLFGLLLLRGYLMGGGFTCSSVIWESLSIPYDFSLENDLLMIGVCTFIWKRKKEKKIQKIKNSAMICLFTIFYSNEHLYHHFEVFFVKFIYH